MTTFLQIEGIEKRFGDLPVLRGVTFDVQQGEVLALVGVSGGGKSTLFHIIAGLLKPDAGDVQLEGKSVLGKPGQMAYMLQKNLLLPQLTILDNVALPLRLKKWEARSARSEALSHFADFGLRGTEEKYPGEISGGMAQRAAFLRTYLFSQKMALLDEPFSALDAITKNQMHRWFLTMLQKMSDMTCLLITHDVDEALKLADRILLLKEGVIKNEWTLQERFRRSPDFPLQPAFLQYKREIVSHLG